MDMKQAGITLLELLTVVALVGIIMAIGLPAFDDMMRTQRAKGAAEGLVAAMQNTKAQAVKANENTSIVFMPEDTNTVHADWCYGMTDIGDVDGICDCSLVPTDCASGSVVDGDLYTNVTLEFNQANVRTFDPLIGDANGTQGTVIFRAGNNINLGVTLSRLGRIRICRPAGTNISSNQDSGACP